MRSPAVQSVPRCPRCGYDQSGACATWTDSCPLDGTCPECGLTFEWADAFNPQRTRLRWLFEHKRPRSPGVIRAAKTWFLALIPPRFWRRVRLSHASPWVVLLWPLVFFGAAAFLAGCVRMGYVLAQGNSAPGRFVVSGGFWTPVQPGSGAYYWLQAQEAWLIPWYPVWVAQWDRSRLVDAVLEVWAAPAAVVAASLVTGLTIMSLRTSRRICGLKSSHIVRAMVYRLAPLGLLYLVWCLGQTGLLRWSPVGVSWSAAQTLWLFALVVPLLWGAWWWSSALTAGWQMPQARTVATLIGIVDVLAAVVTFLLMSPYYAGALLNVV